MEARTAAKPEIIVRVMAFLRSGGCRSLVDGMPDLLEPIAHILGRLGLGKVSNLGIGLHDQMPVILEEENFEPCSRRQGRRHWHR